MKMHGAQIVSLGFLLILYGSPTSGQSLAEVYQLHTDVFSNYKKELVPNGNRSKPFNIEMQFYLISITSFDEVKETIVVLAGIRMTWTDSGISWNPSLYGNAADIDVLQGNIWTPPLVLINSVEDLRPIEGESEFMATVLYNGTVIWSPGGVMVAKCTTDISKFPFDSQTCTLQFGTWGLALPGVSVSTAVENPIDLTFFTPNSNWKLKSYHSYIYLLGGYDIYNVELTIKREPLYFTLMVVCPTLLFGLLNPLVFLLPVESGERVSLAMTILLSYAIFLTLVSAAIPSSSNPMCILLIMMVIIIIVSGFIVAAVIYISYLYHREKTQEIRKFWKFIATRLPWCKAKYNISKNEEETEISAKQEDIAAHLGLHRNNLVKPLYFKKSHELNAISAGAIGDEFENERETKEHLSQKESKSNVSWIDVADSLDMLSMTISFAMMVLILLTFFAVVSN